MSVALILLGGFATQSFADTQSDINAYVEEINAGNYAKAEAKIRIALNNAKAKFGDLHPNTITISYDFADILLLQNKAQEALIAIENVQSALVSKPELSKSADIDSISFVHGLSLAAVAKGETDKDKAAELLKQSVLVFDGQERSDAYLLNAYIFLAQYSYGKDEFASQLKYADKAIIETKRLFPKHDGPGAMLLSEAYYNKAVAIFTDGFKKYGFDGMDEKTGKSLGSNSLKEFGNYDFLLNSARFTQESLKAYGQPKSKSDHGFYKSAVWGSMLFSYLRTLRDSGYKIKNEDQISDAIKSLYRQQQKQDVFTNYKCDDYFAFHDKSEFLLDSSNNFDFGAAYIRFDFDEKDNPSDVQVLGSLPTPLYGEKLKERLEKFHTITAKSGTPQECRKSLLYNWTFGTRGNKNW